MTWLRAKLTDGMSPDERVAIFVNSDGHSVSMFVRLEHVDMASQSIRVRVLARDDRLAVIALPSLALCGRSVMLVRRTELTEDL